MSLSSIPLGLSHLFRAQSNILLALMLRDIQTRFGSAPGFLIAIAWPLSHIMILVVINVGVGRVVPYGDSAILWFALGTTPFMIVSYTSRFMMMGLLMNRPLLHFPAISVFDVLLSRILIEIIVTTGVILSLVAIFTVMDVDFMPVDVGQAFAAIFVSLLLGIGLGLMNSIIAMLMHQWATIYSLSIILLWITSGAYFIPSTLPPQLREFLYYHPIVHCIEWTRTAWFEGYSSLLLDRTYVISFAIYTIFLGLVLERLLRGRVLYV